MSISSTMGFMLRTCRDNYWVSQVSARLLRPVRRFCLKTSTFITWHVRMNGAVIQSHGLSIRFPRDVGLMYSSLMWWEGLEGYEPSNWRVMKHFLARARSFLDVGANIGLYSVLARKLAPALTVDTFEPVPSLYDGCIKFHQANGLVTEGVHQIAVSAASGTSPILVHKYEGNREAEPTASLEADVCLSEGAGRATIQVKTVSLDDFIGAHARPVPMLIKVDVEGHEVSVLRGSLRLLEQCRPIIVCEVLPRLSNHKDLMQILMTQRYAVWGICKEGLFRMLPDDLEGGRSFTDFCCIPAESCPGNKNYLNFDSLDNVRFG